MATSNLDPQIELTINNSEDLIFKAVENRRSEKVLPGGPHRLAGLKVRPAGPTL
jgi:hypothetical protein